LSHCRRYGGRRGKRMTPKSGERLSVKVMREVGVLLRGLREYSGISFAQA
jgi:hypothetical protein